MATFSENISKLKEIKADIKSAIIEKGVEVGDNFNTYADAIKEIQTGYMQRKGENLNKKDEIISNYYLNNGREAGYGNWSITAWIPVEPGKKYYISDLLFALGSLYHEFYDADKTFKRKISPFDFSADYNGDPYLVINVPSGMYYMRLSYVSANVNKLEVCEKL